MADESPKARIDRELIELLNELRVALPGVQVLFAFLLVVPFQGGFANVSALARGVYFAGLVASAVAIAFLIAPATYHRLNLRRSVAEKEEMLLISSKFALIGTAFLAAGIACSMFVVADALFGSLVALVVAGATGLLTAALWFGLPIWLRRRGTREQKNP
jgi:hypothetical protein